MTKEEEVIEDENGEKWKLLAIKPCPRKLEPRKQTFKICFEVECEMELTERQKPHTHIIREKENSILTGIEKLLIDTEDFGAGDCSVMQVLRKANVNVKQKEPIVEPDFEKNYFHFPENYSLHERDFCRKEDKDFRDEIAYLAKHIENELKDIFRKLWEESTEEYSLEREKTILYFRDKEAKSVRKRLNISKYKRKPPSETEKKQFLERCCEQIKLLNRNRKKINQKTLAKELYPNNLDPESKFSDERKKFQISFKKILEECSEMDKIPNRK